MKFRAAQHWDIPWFTEQTSYHPGSQFNGIVAEDDEGEFLGMVGLDYWTPHSVQAHVAMREFKALVPLWREVLHYLRTHGRRLVIGVTPSSNELSLRLQKSLGFKETYRIKDAWIEGVDMVISEYAIHGNEQHESSAVPEPAESAESTH